MSHSKSTNSGSFDLYNRFFEFERIVSTVVVTDEGIFQAGQVPSTYGGAELTLQLVHAVVMVNARSELVIWEFDVDMPMDSLRKTGGPVVRDGVEIKPQTGESTVALIQTTVENPNLDAARKALGAAAKSVFKEELALVPSQPQY